MTYEAERLSTDSLWYGLYNKGIELGMWDVESLIDEVGFEDDREVWESLDDDEREQVRRILAAFLDGEHEVGEDAANHLQRMMGADCLEDNEMKQMYMTVFTLTEHKHTQFIDLYMKNVVHAGEEDNYAELAPREGSRVPVIEATGLGEVFDHQALLTTRAAETGDPVDIAKAATNYHLNVEGTLARSGFYAINKMSDVAPLPLLNRGFKFISTDEGRHITHGVRLLNELIEMEEAGDPEFQGVKDGILDVLEKDVPRMGEFGYMITDSVGDPLGVDYDELIMRGGQLIDGTYNESLGLDVDYISIINRVRTRFDELEDEDVDAKIREQRRLYERRRDAA
jgi:ribonucleotide reductase beta subunit family protein with ferritin-like domain